MNAFDVVTKCCLVAWCACMAWHQGGLTNEGVAGASWPSLAYASVTAAAVAVVLHHTFAPLASVLQYAIWPLLIALIACTGMLILAASGVLFAVLYVGPKEQTAAITARVLSAADALLQRIV